MRSAGEDRVGPGRGDRGGRVAKGEGREPEAERGSLALERLAGKAREGAARGHDGDRGAGPKRSDRPAESHEVAARRRGQRDDAGKALDVVRGGAVVPDHGARAGRGDRARRVAAVRAEHEAAAALEQLGVEPRGPLGPARVVLNHKAGRRSGAPRALARRAPGRLGPRSGPWRAPSPLRAPRRLLAGLGVHAGGVHLCSVADEERCIHHPRQSRRSNKGSRDPLQGPDFRCRLHPGMRLGAGLLWTMAAVPAPVRYASVGGITLYEAYRR